MPLTKNKLIYQTKIPNSYSKLCTKRKCQIQKTNLNIKLKYKNPIPNKSNNKIK